MLVELLGNGVHVRYDRYELDDLLLDALLLERELPVAAECETFGLGDLGLRHLPGDARLVGLRLGRIDEHVHVSRRADEHTILVLETRLLVHVDAVHLDLGAELTRPNGHRGLVARVDEHGVLGQNVEAVEADVRVARSADARLAIGAYEVTDHVGEYRILVQVGQVRIGLLALLFHYGLFLFFGRLGLRYFELFFHDD